MSRWRRRRRILFSAPSNDEDDEMAEKEGETKYANINKEEGEEGYEEEEEEEGQGWRSGRGTLWAHFCT